MQKWAIALGLLLCLGGGAAAAAGPVLSGPNALGLYFDTEANTTDLTVTEPGSLEAYLIFTDPTIAFLNGWEVRVTASDGTMITGVDLPVGTVTTLSGPEEWAATLADPMPCNALTKLAVFTFFTDASQNTFIYLGSLSSPSVAGDLPAVRLQDGSWSMVPVASGDPTLPVAAINATTPNEDRSWGTIKALFR